VNRNVGLNTPKKLKNNLKIGNNKAFHILAYESMMILIKGGNVGKYYVFHNRTFCPLKNFFVVGKKPNLGTQIRMHKYP